MKSKIYSLLYNIIFGWFNKFRSWRRNMHCVWSPDCQWPVPGCDTGYRMPGHGYPGPDHRDTRARPETRIETVSCRHIAATATGISRDHWSSRHWLHKAVINALVRPRILTSSCGQESSTHVCWLYSRARAPCSVSPTLCFVIGTTKNTIMTELFMDREMNYWYQFKMNLAVDWCMDMKQRHSSNLNHHSPTDWFLSRNDLDAAERYKVHQRVSAETCEQEDVT